MRFPEKRIVAAASGGVLGTILIAWALIPKLAAQSETAGPTNTLTGLELLDKQLAASQILGPVAVIWVACPPGGEFLPDTVVRAVAYGDNSWNGGYQRSLMASMNNVYAYYKQGSETPAVYCGNSMGDNPAQNEDNPVKGTVMVIPEMGGCNTAHTGSGTEIKCFAPTPAGESGSISPGQL